MANTLFLFTSRQSLAMLPAWQGLSRTPVVRAGCPEVHPIVRTGCLPCQEIRRTISSRCGNAFRTSTPDTVFHLSCTHIVHPV